MVPAARLNHNPAPIQLRRDGVTVIVLVDACIFVHVEQRIVIKLTQRILSHGRSFPVRFECDLLGAGGVQAGSPPAYQ